LAFGQFTPLGYLNNGNEVIQEEWGTFLPYNELLTHCMASLKTEKTKPSAPRFVIRTLSLTSEDTRILDQLAREASDYIGWTVSGSALVRGLLRHADQQGAGWIREMIAPLIEHEIQEGTVWGKKK
jgi:hypothetical protein